MDWKEEMKTLRDRLNTAGYRYYVLDDPDMPDHEYDWMLRRLEELEAGNREFADAAQETLEALRRLEMEEVSWFLEHFGEAFGLTLDRLQRGEGQSGSPE